MAMVILLSFPFGRRGGVSSSTLSQYIWPGLPKKREWYGFGHPLLFPIKVERKCLILHPLPNKQKGRWP